MSPTLRRTLCGAAPRGLAAACVLGLLLLTGCSERLPSRHPVSGRVLVNGKPAAGAEVAFWLAGTTPSDGVPGRATTGPEGEFQVTMYEAADGLPAGRYAVTVVWPTVVRNMLGEDEPGPDRFRGRYADPAQPLREVEVVEGDNQLPPLEISSR